MTAILYFTGRSMNDALGAAGRAHRVLFEELGHDYVEIDLAGSDGHELLNETMRHQRIEFAYGAVGWGAELRGQTENGQDVNLWEANRIPFISVSGDSPAYFFDRHIMPSPWHACLYCYPEHLELRRRLKPTPVLYGIVPAFPRDVTKATEIDFRKKEAGKLLFLKNGNDPEHLVQMWRNAMPAEGFVHLAGLASELVAGFVTGTDADCDIDARVTAYFQDRGWDVNELVNFRLFMVAQLDDYLRRVKSTMIADVIADFPVEIHGFNWEHFDFSRRRAKFMPGGDYEQSRQEILDSLGIIDMSPNTQLLPHERPMRAIGLHTLFLTNEQRYFKEQYLNSALFCYRFDKENMREKVAEVLAHPKQYVELGRSVAEQFLQRCQPQDFSRFMVETASLVRVACAALSAPLQEFFIWPPTKVR